jgi:CHAT domain-containing protein
MDLLFQSATAMAPAEGHSQLAQNIRELREELNWYYHRIEQEQLNKEERSPERIQKLQAQLRERESDFLRVLRELPSDEAQGAALQPPPALSLDEIRQALPEGATLLEYFQINEQIFALLFDGTELKIFPITLRSRLATLLRQLQFQISKFDYGEDYTRRFASPLLAAAQGHLHELYKELISPLERSISGDRIIVVPHGLLHYCPFHAFYDGTQYLADRFCCSYAPSASIFAMCQRRQANANGSTVLFGVPDERAPHIRDEVQAIADIFPGSKVFLDSEASVNKLREVSREARLLHVATHGFFRQDNPMFSGVRMADAHLSLYDLYQLKLPCELVTLSGCATGLNVIAAGDELLGLVRGLLHAGAKSLLLSLWNVHDHSATELMSLFYSRLASSASKAEALQNSMRELRTRFPHPYYWAAFKIVGAS